MKESRRKGGEKMRMISYYQLVACSVPLVGELCAELCALSASGMERFGQRVLVTLWISRISG